MLFANNFALKNHLQISKMDDIEIVETPSNLLEEATLSSDILEILLF